MKTKTSQFNMLIVGTGGQGQITLLQILAEAAFLENYDIRASELHGLSQRGGSVEAHLRLGEKIYSPLVSKGKADLILGLEMQEALGAYPYANSKTNFLVNKYTVPPLFKDLTEAVILKNLKKIGRVVLIPAAEICQKELNTDLVAGVYLISLASFKNLIPLKPSSVLRAIKRTIPKKYLELNIKTFNLAKPC